MSILWWCIQRFDNEILLKLFKKERLLVFSTLFVYSIAKFNIGFEVNFKSDVFAFKRFYNSNPSVIPFNFVKSLFT